MRFEFLPDLAIVFMLMFARIGTLVMLLPGLGESVFPTRIRLASALLLTLVFLPLERQTYPASFTNLWAILVLLGGELLVGFTLGITGRLLMSSLQTAGTVIAQQLGLGFVTTIDPTQGQQGALVGSFLSLVGMALLFATNLHHLVIAALGESYQIFRPGALPIAGDSLRYVVDLVASTFKVAIQISAPFLLFGLVFNAGLGILARLMPQMQVFFVAVPASILIGFSMLILVLAAVMTVFLDSLREGLGALLMLR